jgi:hypothetical protein
MIYKKQLRKALSRGLRGQTNNVPGSFGRIFHRTGKDIAKDIELDYVKVEDCSTRSKLSLRLLLLWPYHHELTVIHGSKIYTVDLSAYFYDFDSIKDHIK